MVCEALTNHDILRLSSSIIVLRSGHRVCFLRNIFGKRSDLPFSRKRDRKKEKSVVSFTHEQNIICSQTKLRMSRPLFVGSYLQVTMGEISVNEKEEKFATNDNFNYFITVLTNKMLVLAVKLSRLDVSSTQLKRGINFPFKFISDNQCQEAVFENRTKKAGIKSSQWRKEILIFRVKQVV